MSTARSLAKFSPSRTRISRRSVAGEAEGFEPAAEIIRQRRVAEHEIRVAGGDPGLGLCDRLIPIVDVVVAAAEPDQRQKIGLLLDIEPGDKLDRLAPADVVVRIAFHR